LAHLVQGRKLKTQSSNVLIRRVDHDYGVHWVVGRLVSLDQRLTLSYPLTSSCSSAIVCLAIRRVSGPGVLLVGYAVADF